MKEPAFVEKLKRGTVGFLTVMPRGEFPMGKTLAQWTVYCLAISVVVAYVTGRTLGVDALYLEVFRISGTVAFLAYAGGDLPDDGPSGGAAPMLHVSHGLLYGLLTGGAFGVALAAIAFA